MKFDLENMPRKELEKLRSDVDKAIASVDERNRKKARDAAETAAKEYGFDLDELLGESAPKKKSVAKYRNPENTSQTWTGRGRKPGWMNDALATGRPMEDFEI